MNILHLFQDEYPWDVRVEKIVNSLSTQHKVTILCRNRGKLKPSDTLGAVDIFRVGGSGISSVKGFPAFFSPWWIATGLQLIRSKKIGLIIVRDLPLCPLALILKRLAGLPVIFDMAEDYPAMLSATWKYRGPGPVDYVIRNPRLLRHLENYVLPRVDETWVVSGASRDRILQRTNGRVRIVGNSPTIDILECEPRPPEDREPLRIVYTGWIDEDRGIDTVIRAVALARQAGVSVIFKVVGSGTMMKKLEFLSNELEVANCIQFLGWKSQCELRDIVMDCDIGIVPHHVTDHTNTTLPNKIFDYMALAKPVIASNAAALEEVISSSGCGLIFRDGDPESLLNCLRELKSVSLRQAMGTAGRREVESSRNWAVEELVILRGINEFEKKMEASRALA